MRYIMHFLFPLSLSRSNSASSTYISIFPDPFCKCIPPMKRKIVGTCDTPRRLLNPSLRQGTKALPRDQWYRDRPLPNLRFDGSGRGPLARWSSKLKRFLGIAIQKGERDGMIILIMIKGQFVPEKINITYFLRMTATVARNLTHIQYADYFISHLIWLIHPLIFFLASYLAFCPTFYRSFFSGIWFCNRHAGPARRAPESERVRDGVSEIWWGLTSQLVGKNENKNNLVT